MYSSNRATLILTSIVAAMFLPVEVGNAQFIPRRFFGGNFGDYYGYDPVFSAGINDSIAAYQMAFNQNREFQAQTSMERTAAWQNINQSLAQQANQQTQSMLAQRQSARDWWFQIEAQRLAESRARAFSKEQNLPETEPLEPYESSPQTPSHKPAAKEIMVWPTLLRSPEFDSLRAMVESPFRRAFVDKKPLTADDYRGIIQAIDGMRAKLKGLSSQVVESEYAAVESYLNDLTADAVKRLNARLSPKSPEDKVETPPTKP